MGFTIEIAAPYRQSPERDNRELKDELVQAFPGLTDFPLDHDLIAKEYARVPREEVLEHWAQFELHADDSLGNATVGIWLSAVFIELTSTPPESCEARLLRVMPLLETLAQRGFHVPPLADMVVDYEEQRRRVEAVSRLV